ncbi:hypothetical protein [Microbacterium sp. SA39]|uniref:hypothetical protein n=1 Tax=Microbacterium sp. SA39 TaxID=1263625 RepID=UPI0006201FD3|nr:hypothetical protein [Microbacterium sp. SA39]KJQ55117.1 hypothetical protein RS85_01177 [Microbacterium sp. SA39]
MTIDVSTYRRVLRRETHASRTIAAVAVASAVLVILLALVVGGVGWLIDPVFRENTANAGAGIAEFAGQPAAAVGTGVALVLLALLILALAVTPGRQARRARTTDRAALLVDDGVIADSIAERVAGRTGVARRQVSVTVGRRITSVRITPTSGLPVDRAAAEAAVADTVSGIGFATTPRVIITAEGVIA